MQTDVFRKLQLKLSLSILLVQAIVLLVLLGSLNLYLHASNLQGCYAFIEDLVQGDGIVQRKNTLEKTSSDSGAEGSDFYNEGRLPAKKASGSSTDDGSFRLSTVSLLGKFYPFKTEFSSSRDFYTARVDGMGTVVSVVNGFWDDDGSDVHQGLVSEVFRLSKTYGKDRNFVYCVTRKNYGYLVVIVDRMNEISQECRFLGVSFMFFIISLLFSFFMAWGISYGSIKPVHEAFVKQKQFIADASHELKTPIAVIGANIDVLEQEIPPNKWLEYIKTENARMSALVKDMLYLARDDAGRTELNMLPFDMVDATACSVLPFESVAFEQGKTLEMNLPRMIIPVVGDESKIKQVIIILTDNALKNSDKGALIRISVGVEAGRCVVTVYNTGRGISSEDMQKIFGRFYRADSSRARTTGGYGLGLAIAKSIVQGHRGKISVKSEEGSYAEFSFSLPMDDKILRKSRL